MQCTANSAGECHLDVVEVQGSNPWPCKQEGSPNGLPFLLLIQGLPLIKIKVQTPRRLTFP